MANINVNQNLVPEVGTDVDDTFTYTIGLDNSTAVGRNGNDTFTLAGGSSNNNLVFGEDGNDKFILGGDGNNNNNFLDGGAGNDHFTQNPDADNNVFVGGTGFDGLKINADQNVTVTVNNDGTGAFSDANGDDPGTFSGIEAFELSVNNDTFNGSTNAEVVLGGLGSDTLNGGGGNDYLLGTTFAAGGGLTVDNAKNTLNGGDGDDVIVGAQRGDVMRGGTGNDVIVSFSENDGGVDAVLDGGTGNDIMLAGSAGATVYGGASGLDYTRLGVGNDTVQVDGKAQWLMIDAFQAGAGNEDQIIVSSQSGISTFDQLLSHAVEFTGSNGAFGTLVRFDNGNVIYLNGVHKSSLVANDFDFTNAAFS